MSLIDQEKEFHATRCELSDEIRKLADTQEDWGAEDEEKYAKISADYKENYAKLEGVQKQIKAQVERKTEIDKQIAECEAHAASYQAPKNIGRDGGDLKTGPMNPETFGDSPQDYGDNLPLAIQGWLIHNSTFDSGDVLDKHREAAKACGVRIDKRAIQFTLGNTESFKKTRAAMLANQPQSALTTTTGSSGGFTIGETMVQSLERAMLAFGGILQVADVIRTASGDPMSWPTADDTGNTGEQLGESGGVNTTTDPTFGQVLWNAYKFSSKAILVPQELLEDSVFDLAGVISEMLGERLGRIQNNKYTLGSGAGTPKGITIAAAAGITTASTTAIAFDEIIDLEHTIDPSRRALPGVGYMFHDGILQALRKLKDGEGRYLWQSGANSGAPDTLNTKPYTINQDMQSTIATGTITMLFGQFSKYKVRQVNQIRLYHLQERYRDNDQDGFMAFIRADGNLLDAGDNPVKKMTQL